MPDTAALLDTLIKAGGWAFAAIVIAGGAWKLYQAVKNGDLVPGKTHQREIERADKNAALLARFTDVEEKRQEQLEAILDNGRQLTEVVTKTLAARSGRTE